MPEKPRDARTEWLAVFGGPKCHFVNANLSLHLGPERLASRTRPVRRWHRFCLPQVLLGIPKRKNERLFILAREEHDRVLEPRIATEVRQYTLAEKRYALFRRDARRRDRGDTHEHAASLAREAVVDELHIKPLARR